MRRFLIVLSALACPVWALAQNVIVPNSLAATEGNSNNAFPFNLDAWLLTSQRYQQVYSSSQFSSITRPTFITAISFRTDFVVGASFANGILPSVQINLSTTSAAPDALSGTFASNIGGNDAVVYIGSLTLSSTSSTPFPPHAFDVVISLQTPFLYDPSAGNLLMDVRNTGAGLTAYFDAESTLGDSISRVYTQFNAGSSPVGDQVDSNGLVTQFTFAAVPEPTTWALIGIGIAGASGVIYRRKNMNARALECELRT
ncbi:MAG: PEP-CTERM sorting domain-containing protein [Gemmatales bacterium]